MVDFSISLLYKQKGGPPLGTTSLGCTVGGEQSHKLNISTNILALFCQATYLLGLSTSEPLYVILYV